MIFCLIVPVESDDRMKMAEIIPFGDVSADNPSATTEFVGRKNGDVLTDLDFFRRHDGDKGRFGETQKAGLRRGSRAQCKFGELEKDLRRALEMEKSRQILKQILARSPSLSKKTIELLLYDEIRF